jgi:hypothetical protein
MRAPGTVPNPDSRAAPSPRAAISLFLLGFVTLYFELVLIRYLAGSIWNLGFFPNLVLMGAFIGMGIGFVGHQFLTSRVSDRLLTSVPLAITFLVVCVSFFSPSLPGFDSSAGEIGGEIFFTSTAEEKGTTNYALFALWFSTVVAIFAMIAQYTAKLFARFDPLHAYSLDIGGSCAGIVSFMILSWLHAPAWFWFLLLIPLLGAARSVFSIRHAVAVLAILVGASALVARQDNLLLADPDHPGGLEVEWSPYQKVEYAHLPDADSSIYVNGLRHQTMHQSEGIAAGF